MTLFTNLKLDFGSPPSEVASKRRHMLRELHPDKIAQRRAARSRPAPAPTPAPAVPGKRDREPAGEGGREGGGSGDGDGEGDGDGDLGDTPSEEHLTAARSCIEETAAILMDPDLRRGYMWIVHTKVLVGDHSRSRSNFAQIKRLIAQHTPPEEWKEEEAVEARARAGAGGGARSGGPAAGFQRQERRSQPEEREEEDTEVRDWIRREKARGHSGWGWMRRADGSTFFVEPPGVWWGEAPPPSSWHREGYRWGTRNEGYTGPPHVGDRPRRPLDTGDKERDRQALAQYLDRMEEFNKAVEAFRLWQMRHGVGVRFVYRMGGATDDGWQRPAGEALEEAPGSGAGQLQNFESMAGATHSNVIIKSPNF